MGILDFFSQEAGQGRRKWLDGQTQDVLEALQFYAGPSVDVESTAGLLSMFNPVQDVGEAMRDTRDGDYIGAAANTLSALAPVGAYKLAGAGATDDIANVLQDTLMGFGMKAQGATDAGRRFAGDEFGGVGPGKQGITAYHGSPHSFDRFSMDAIGTGEGAQAYGHGLYFAENEGVARGYRDALRFPRIQSRPDTAAFDGGMPLRDQVIDDLNYYQGNVDAARSSYEGMMGSEIPEIKDYAAQKIALLEDVNKQFSGSMYEVNINANPDDFLDWDAPLSGQPENVRRAYGQASAGNDPLLSELLDGSPESIPLMGLFPNSKGSQAYNSLMEKGFEDGAVGLNLPAGNPMKPADKWSTERLRSAGIPGIKYKDAGSRGLDGDGTRNFVVFDENLIEIVKKYGIAGAAAMLGVSAADVEDAMNGS